MTGRYVLHKDHLKGFLRKVARQHRLVAPVRNAYGDLLFEVVNSVDSVNLDLTEQAQDSAKSFLFPQQEAMFRYRCGPDGAYTFSSVHREKPTVYFGLRSCDISAILYMDMIFLRPPKDTHYLRRRNEAVLIGIGCSQPGDNCFCNVVRTGPFLKYGYDLQLTDLGDRYFVEVGHTKGEVLVRQWPQFFRQATEDAARLQYQAVLEARAGFKRHVHVNTAFRRLAAGEVDESVWTDMALRCQGCGGRAYVCPICTCFTIVDKPISEHEGERLRCWDACTHAGFTRMAGGNNPVDMRRDVLKRRFMHKLYYDVMRYGRPSCVGCGRCVDICFGGIDIVKFIDQFSERGKETPESTRVMLGKLLIEANLIDRNQLQTALARQLETGRSLGSILVAMGYVTREEVAGALALQRK
jgi:Fe-S-cluster-containing hydrogenase component 2